MDCLTHAPWEASQYQLPQVTTDDLASLCGLLKPEYCPELLPEIGTSPDSGLSDLDLSDFELSDSAISMESNWNNAVYSDSELSPGSPSPVLADPVQPREICCHVYGSRNIATVMIPTTTTMGETRNEILEAQLKLRNCVSRADFDRVVLLMSPPTTMNTTCHFDEDEVIQPNSRKRLSDYPMLSDVYLYLLCPKPCLITEHGAVHRRLAKRDAGVCEAHRSQAIRAQKKLRAMGLDQSLLVPAVEADIVNSNGESVAAESLQKLREEVTQGLTSYLQDILAKHQMVLKSTKFTDPVDLQPKGKGPRRRKARQRYA